MTHHRLTTNSLMFDDNNEDQGKENADFGMNVEDTDNNVMHILKIHKIAAALVPSVKVRPF